jgi:hypothetical protein
VQLPKKLGSIIPFLQVFNQLYNLKITYRPEIKYYYFFVVIAAKARHGLKPQRYIGEYKKLVFRMPDQVPHNGELDCQVNQKDSSKS